MTRVLTVLLFCDFYLTYLYVLGFLPKRVLNVADTSIPRGCYCPLRRVDLNNSEKSQNLYRSTTNVNKYFAYLFGFSRDRRTTNTRHERSNLLFGHFSNFPFSSQATSMGQLLVHQQKSCAGEEATNREGGNVRHG